MRIQQSRHRFLKIQHDSLILALFLKIVIFVKVSYLCNAFFIFKYINKQILKNFIFISNMLNINSYNAHI